MWLIFRFLIYGFYEELSLMWSGLPISFITVTFICVLWRCLFPPNIVKIKCVILSTLYSAFDIFIHYQSSIDLWEQCKVDRNLFIWLWIFRRSWDFLHCSECILWSWILTPAWELKEQMSLDFHKSLEWAEHKKQMLLILLKHLNLRYCGQNSLHTFSFEQVCEFFIMFNGSFCLFGACAYINTVDF